MEPLLFGGVHILMNARVADVACFEREKLLELFRGIVKLLDMEPLGDVQVYEVPVDPKALERMKATGNFEDEGGTSVILAITTSHLSLHAWPLQKYVAMDVFSCKDYKAEKALNFIRKKISIQAESTLVVKRMKPSEDSTQSSVCYIEM